MTPGHWFFVTWFPAGLVVGVIECFWRRDPYTFVAYWSNAAFGSDIDAHFASRVAIAQTLHERTPHALQTKIMGYLLGFGHLIIFGWFAFAAMIIGLSADLVRHALARSVPRPQ